MVLCGSKSANIVISAFWKTHSYKLIPNWTPNRMITYTKLVYLNGNNAAEGGNNIKYAHSYPMNWTVNNWFTQDIFESLW